VKQMCFLYLQFAKERKWEGGATESGAMKWSDAGPYGRDTFIPMGHKAENRSMTTSLTEYLTSEAHEFDSVDVGDLAYFRERFRNRVHSLMLQTFREKETTGLTRCELSRLMHKRPEQVTRILGAPGNLTLETISDFFLALGLEPEVSAVDLKRPRSHNYEHELAGFVVTKQENASNAIHIRPTAVAETSSKDTGNVVHLKITGSTDSGVDQVESV
jgi:hypothetical protein